MRKSSLIILITLAFSCVSALGFYIRPVSAIIWIEGHITSDTTWMPVDTYRLIGDTFVDPNVTLTISPGVHVQFADGFSLVVLGTLNATGTEDERIVFTSSRVANSPSNPHPGAWKSIRFQSAFPHSMFLKYVNIEYATDGITFENQGSSIVELSSISYCSHSGVCVASKANARIVDSTVEFNYNGFTIYDSGGNNGIIVKGNRIWSNYHDGVDIVCRSYVDFQNITIDGNDICFNSERGLHCYIETHVNTGNIEIRNNRFSCNSQSGIRVTQVFGGSLTILNNSISGSNIGVDTNHYADNLFTNLTLNSIAYNSIGVFYMNHNPSPHYNTILQFAEMNDIYSNGCGMNFSGRCIIQAEHNYWGHPTGPYHSSLNPEGQGDSVGGNGIDLDFIPFLTSPQGHINQRPVAALSVDKKTVGMNETITFDATSSTDDGRIDYYFFDFGDGTNSSWTTLPVVTHKYTQQKTYNATLMVMDDFGVTSNNTQQAVMQVIVVPEFPSVLVLPLFMIATLLAVIAYRKKRISTR